MASNYNDFQDTQRRMKALRDKLQANAENRIQDNYSPVCAHFGCGKHLTPVESLYGDKCFKHAQEAKQIKSFDL